MACEYCDGSKAILEDTAEPYGDGAILEMRGNELTAVGIYDGGYCSGTATATIDFCPMCGRDLRGDGA